MNLELGLFQNVARGWGNDFGPICGPRDGEPRITMKWWLPEDS